MDIWSIHKQLKSKTPLNNHNNDNQLKTKIKRSVKTCENNNKYDLLNISLTNNECQYWNVQEICIIRKKSEGAKMTRANYCETFQGWTDGQPWPTLVLFI